MKMMLDYWRVNSRLNPASILYLWSVPFIKRVGFLQSSSIIQIMNYIKFQKHVNSQQAKSKFKKQCLKNKNILFENDQLQIGCKINNIYDFYSSSNYLQINLFVGNKTDRQVDSFKLDFRATPNIELFVEEKNRSLKERTQYKERIIVGCNNYEEEILILMDFQSSLVTLKSSPLPITLYTFCMYGEGQTLPPTIQTQNDLQQLLQKKYEYTQQKQITVNASLFKKGFRAEMQKYFTNLIKICDGVFLGNFTTKTLVNEHTIVFKMLDERSLKISLSSNEYKLFDNLFHNLKFIFE